MWPKFELDVNNEPELQEKTSTITVQSNVLVNLDLPQPEQNLSKIFTCKHYSGLDKLFGITAIVLKFINNLKRRVRKENTKNKDLLDPELQQAQQAKVLWHKEVQKEVKSDPKFDEMKTSLKILEDDQGVLKVGGRLDNANIPHETKFPVLLRKRNHFTELVIKKCHEIVKHNGTNETLTEPRSQYWICRGRQTVKTILAKCVPCKKQQGKSCDTPTAPPLPSFGVSENLAFSNIAVDFAGPLFVKNIYGESKDMHKCYVALFTCASTPAIHLELTPDLHANSFIRVLK